MGRHERTARALASMRRRGIALSGLAMVVAGLIWAAFAWGAADRVEVLTPTGPEVVNVSDVTPTVNATYNVNGKPVRVEAGRSLQRVLSSEEIGVESDAWTRLLFDEGVVVNGDKYVNNRLPVFYFPQNDQSREAKFIIPKQKGVPAQVVEGNFSFNLRGRIDIDPDEVEPEEGDTQTFSATVVDGGPQNVYTFNWKTSTGQTGTGKTFEATFNTSGPMSVSVSARRSGSVVAEGSVATDVKAAPPSNNGSGFGNGSGYYDSPSYSSPGGSYTPPSDYDSNFPDVDPDSTVPDDIKVPKTETEEEPEEIFGEPVSGELLSAVAALPPASGEGEEADPAQESASDPEEAVEEAKKISGPGALIGAGVVIGLLGLGAGREMENVRPRRLRRPDLSALRRLSPPWK